MKRSLMLISLVIALFFVGGCELNSMPNPTIKLLMYYAIDPCLFTINNYANIEVSIGTGLDFDFETLELTGKIVSTKTRTLTQKERLELYKLIEAVISSDSENIKEQSMTDTIEVAALINGKMYRSTYVTDTEASGISPIYLNSELLNLTYKLIELSPIQVGGEYNPIIAPNQK